MSLWYRALYALGVTPWESDQATLAPQFDSLVLSEEAERGEPYGPALDLGCGTGYWTVELALRGWDVIGVDIVPKAIQAARFRAESANIDVKFFEGDVTSLRDTGIDGEFSFFLDVECFNHLDDFQRIAMGKEVDAVAADSATMLMLAWSRARRGPLPPGADPDDLNRAFPAWSIIEEQPYSGELPFPLRGISPSWYRLQRS